MLLSALFMPLLAVFYFRSADKTVIEPLQFYKWTTFSYTAWIILPVVLGLVSTMLMYDENQNDMLDIFNKKLKEKGYQLIWQTGKLDFAEISSSIQHPASIQIKEFISDMATAYSAADVIVSRAGAIAISELAVAKKPVLLVPFPFAAEDHQTKNAMTLVEKNAARMVKDTEMKEKFWNTLSEICENENLRKEMSQNLEFFAKPKASEDIVNEIFNLLNINK